MITSLFFLRLQSSRSRLVAGVLVFAVTLVLFPFPLRSATATLTFSPSSGTHVTGTTFSVNVLVNTDVAINAAEATVSFPKDKLNVKSISKSGSKFTLWAVEPVFSNANGTVTFSGGLPNPGFTGNGGKILTMTFLAKATGTAKLTMSGAQVLANDGQGTNVARSTGTATYTLTAPSAPPPPEPSRPAPTITSTSHPDQAVWYPKRAVEASWRGGAGVKGYSTVFDQSADSVPREGSQGLGTTFARTVDADGVWYLHVRAQYDAGWSQASHYVFRIDATPPDPFTVTFEREGETATTAKVLFATEDATSGVARYEMKLDDGAYAVATSPATLEGLAAAEHTVMVRATDNAGNATEASALLIVKTLEGPKVVLDAERFRLIGIPNDLPVVIVGTPLILRGYAQSTDTIRVIVRSAESVFEFPVAENVDPDPIEPAPPGLTAWKVEFDPDRAPGVHEIRVMSINALGQESPEAPVIRYRVVSNVVRIGNVLIPVMLLLQVTLGLVAVLLGVIVLLVIKLRRHRRRLRLARSQEQEARNKE